MATIKSAIAAATAAVVVGTVIATSVHQPAPLPTLAVVAPQSQVRAEAFADELADGRDAISSLSTGLSGSAALGGSAVSAVVASKAKSAEASKKKKTTSSTVVSRPSSPGAIDLRRAAMWDRIAQCESTGRWNINTGNGYYGGLQFSIPTWRGYGGGQFASRADLASRAEQITVANRVYDRRGGASPDWACARRLGIG